MTNDEVQGYMNGVLEVTDGDIPRKLFKKIVKMMDEVDSAIKNYSRKEYVPYPVYPQRHYWWHNNDLVWFSNKSEIPDRHKTYTDSVSAYAAQGKLDAQSYTT